MEESRYRLWYHCADHSFATKRSCLLRHTGCLPRSHVEPPHFRTDVVEEGEEGKTSNVSLVSFPSPSSHWLKPTLWVGLCLPHPSERVTRPLPEPPREQEPLRAQPKQYAGSGVSPWQLAPLLVAAVAL